MSALPTTIVAGNPNHIAHHNKVHVYVNGLWSDVRDPDFGALGDGSHDDTTNINSAISTGTTHFGATPDFYACTGTLTINNLPSVVLHGSGNATGGASSAATIVYSGTGARFIDARSTLGFKMIGLMAYYSASGFVGSFVDLSHGGPASDSSLWSIEDCYIGGVEAIGQTAVLIDLDKATEGSVVGGNIVGGGIGVRGKNGATYSNAITISGHIRFGGQAIAAVQDAGQGWLVTATFEEGVDLKPRAYKSSHVADGLTFLGCWFGDSASAGILIDFNGAGLVIIGCYLGGDAASTALNLGPSTNGVLVAGNVFEVWSVAWALGTNSFAITEENNAYSTVTTHVTGTRSADTRLSDGALGLLSVSLSASDVTITGWGAGAAVSSMFGSDNGWVIKVTAGAGPSANPSIKVTYKLPWQSQPRGTVCYGNHIAFADAGVAPMLEMDTVTDAFIYWPSTPTNGRTYEFFVRVGL